jgi:hypothetical protein
MTLPILAALLLTVALVLLLPLGVSAQVTHSGTFVLDGSSFSQFAPYKVSQAEDVVLTVCVTSGPDVEVLANGSPAPGVGNVGAHGCKTRRLSAVQKITIGTTAAPNSGDVSRGTYTLTIP